MLSDKQLKMAKVIENYFGADAGYLDIDCFTLAKRIMEAGWEKPARCKDCKHLVLTADGEHNPEDCVCNYFLTDGLTDNDFCSRGEPRAIIPTRARDTTTTITENTKNAILRIGEQSHP